MQHKYVYVESVRNVLSNMRDFLLKRKMQFRCETFISL